MTTIEVLLPAMGEGITDATITRWLVEEGDVVEEDQPLVEIATDKVDSEIPAPAAGTIKKIISKEGETPKIGEVLAVIATDAQAPVDDEEPEYVQDRIPEQVETPFENEQSNLPEETPVFKQPSPVLSNKIKIELQDRYISPFIRNLAKTNNISLEELSAIPGSGANGRLTKHDVLDYLNRRLTSSADQSSLQNATKGAVPILPLGFKAPRLKLKKIMAHRKIQELR